MINTYFLGLCQRISPCRLNEISKKEDFFILFSYLETDWTTVSALEIKVLTGKRFTFKFSALATRAGHI